MARHFDVHHGLSHNAVIRFRIVVVLAGRAEFHQITVDIAADAQDRMNHQKGVHLHALHLAGDRTHQERHIIVDDLNDRARVAAVDVGHREFGRVDFALLQKFPGAGRYIEQGFRRAGFQLVGRAAGKELVDEAGKVAGLAALFRAGLFFGQGHDGSDNRGKVVLGRSGHGLHRHSWFSPNGLDAR